MDGRTAARYRQCGREGATPELKRRFREAKLLPTELADERCRILGEDHSYTLTADFRLASGRENHADYDQFCVLVGIRYLAVMDGDTATPEA